MGKRKVKKLGKLKGKIGKQKSFTFCVNTHTHTHKKRRRKKKKKKGP